LEINTLLRVSSSSYLSITVDNRHEAVLSQALREASKLSGEQ